MAPNAGYRTQHADLRRGLGTWYPTSLTFLKRKKAHPWIKILIPTHLGKNCRIIDRSSGVSIRRVFISHLMGIILGVGVSEWVRKMHCWSKMNFSPCSMCVYGIGIPEALIFQKEYPPILPLPQIHVIA